MITVNTEALITTVIAIIVSLAATLLFSAMFIDFLKDVIKNLRDGLMDNSPESLFPITAIGCILAILVGLSVIGLLYSVGILNLT